MASSDVKQYSHLLEVAVGSQGVHILVSWLSSGVQYRRQSWCAQPADSVVVLVPSWLVDIHPLTCPCLSVIGSGSIPE